MLNDQFEPLLKRIGLKFTNLKLLRTAFTHRSYLNENKKVDESNERMEFLGDAVLSFIVSSYLFQLRPNDPEGDLTNLRSYIVQTKSLAEVSEKLNLGHYLLLSKGEEISGGRKNTQLLANTFEALLGAIYLDQGLGTAAKLIHKFLLPIFERELQKGPPKDAKSRLQELVQTQTKKSPLYKILKTSGPDHAKKFLVGVFVKGQKLGEGSGSSKQEAEEIAAKEALRKLT
ncbi:ribonuclease III [Candidatus Daviesbacteria bacterium]|nr:ribonuclease III [Candidatus Daviesbacteria bacterium]